MTEIAGATGWANVAVSELTYLDSPPSKWTKNIRYRLFLIIYSSYSTQLLGVSDTATLSCTPSGMRFLVSS